MRGRRPWSICLCTALRRSRRYLLALSLLVVLIPGPLGAGEVSLSEAIARSQEYQFGIKAARSDSLAGIKRYLQVRTLRFPTLSLDARTRFINKLQSISTPLFTKEMGSKDSYQADLMLSMPIYTGGRISGQIKRAHQAGLADASALQAKCLETAYRCRRAYLNIMAAGAVVEASQASLDRVRIVRDDVQHLYDNGLADSLDILEAEQALEAARRVLNDSRSGAANAAAALNMMMGLAADEVVTPTESAPEPSDESLIIIEAAPDLKRPELQRLDYAANAMEQAVALARGDYFPVLSGFAGYSVGMPNQDMFEKSWNDYFSVGLSLTWQFNLGGAAHKGVQEAQAQATSARMQHNDLRDALMLQATTSANTVHQVFRSYQIARREYDIADHKYRLARQRQQAGRLSVNRLLEMEAQLTAAQQQLDVARIHFYLAESDYLYAIGSKRIFGGLR